MAYVQKTRPKMHVIVCGECLTVPRRSQLACERVHAKDCPVRNENSPKNGKGFAKVALLSGMFERWCPVFLYESASAQIYYVGVTGLTPPQRSTITNLGIGKRTSIPSPPENKPRYLTIVHPYPLNANLQLNADRRAVALWLACCTGKDVLLAMFYTPNVSLNLSIMAPSVPYRLYFT